MVIDETGKKLGVLNTFEAVNIAKEKGLDLVEVAPQQRPPITKIMDFGKWLYEKEKAARKKKKEQKDQFKMIRIGFNTEDHDLEIKAKKVDDFLKKNSKVMIELRLKGRQIPLKNIAEEKIKKFLSFIKEPHEIERGIKVQPRSLNIVIKKS